MFIATTKNGTCKYEKHVVQKSTTFTHDIANAIFSYNLANNCINKQIHFTDSKSLFNLVKFMLRVLPN